MGGNTERYLRHCHAIRQRLPIVHRQHHAKMRHRHGMAIHGIDHGNGFCRRIKMGDDLMTEQVEIDPLIR